MPGALAYPVAALVAVIAAMVLPDPGSRLQALGGIVFSGLVYTALWAAITWLQLHEEERLRVKRMLNGFCTMSSWRLT